RDTEKTERIAKTTCSEYFYIIYVPYGKSADSNPRHAVLERLLKAQNRIDKPLFKPKFEHQNYIFLVLMLF
nr:hypothetical protein [Eubacteriales bacterium]